MITLITPTRLDPNRLPWLEQLSQSLSSSPIEHLIVIDGEEQEPPINLSASKIIFTGKPSGAGSARNIGLLHAQGDYIGSVDDDDAVNVQGFLNLAEKLDTHSDIDWVSGYLHDMEENGSLLSPWIHRTPLKRLVAGEIFTHWKEPSAEFPIAPTAVLARKEALLSVGGWGALPQAEDFMMIMKLTGEYAGLSTDEIVYYYRKHQQQMTKEEGFPLLEQDCRRLCYEVGFLKKNQTRKTS